MDAEHVEADAEVAEPRLEARAMGAMGCIVKLDHLAEEAEASARQSARSQELNRRVGTVALERTAGVEARREAEIVQEAGEVEDLAVVGPAIVLADRVGEDMSRIRAELETLVRIPSISHPGHDPSQLGRSAEATAKILRDACCETKIVDVTATPIAPRFRMAPTKSVSRRSPTTPTNTPPTNAPAAFERSWIIVTRPMYRGNSVSWPASSKVS